MTDLCFIDTETLGLDPDAPIWEFAAVRRFSWGSEDRTEFRIQHNPAHWLEELAQARYGQQFIDDYTARYDRHDALTESDAAIMMNIITKDALVIACNPGFDLPRIEKLIRRHGMEPSWHYHPFDISSIVFGALSVWRPYAEHMAATAAAVFNALVGGQEPTPTFDEWVPGPPWKSDVLAAAVGVKAEDYARHTAAGDVDWTIAQWDAVMGRRAVS